MGTLTRSDDTLVVRDAAAPGTNSSTEHCRIIHVVIRRSAFAVAASAASISNGIHHVVGNFVAFVPVPEPQRRQRGVDRSTIRSRCRHHLVATSLRSSADILRRQVGAVRRIQASDGRERESIEAWDAGRIGTSQVVRPPSVAILTPQ